MIDPITEGASRNDKMLVPRITNDARNNALRLEVVTPNTTQIVTAANFKTYWGLSDTPDATIYAVIELGVRDAVQAYIRRYLLETSLRLWYDKTPNQNWVELPKPPTKAASLTVKWYDQDDVETVFDGTNYRLVYRRNRGRVVLRTGATWPSDNLRNVEAISFSYDAGWPNVGSIPGGLVLAFYRLLGDFWEQRADFCKASTKIDASCLSCAQQLLLRPWRVAKL